MASQYCERSSNLMLAEPLNLVSSFGFLIAAIFIARALWQHRLQFRETWDIWLLCMAAVAIGISSTLWHSFASPATELADILAITLFVNIYLISWMVRIAAFRRWQIVGLFIGFHLLSLFLIKPFPEDFLNDSYVYFPLLLTLVICTIYLKKQGAKEAAPFGMITLVFGISLFLRTLDPAFCSLWSGGLHFGWHLLNSWIVYRLIQLLLLSYKDKSYTPEFTFQA